MVLEFLQVRRDIANALCCGLIHQRNRSLVSRLGAKPGVIVDLIGSQHHVNRSLEADKGDIAGVVVIVQQRLSAQGQIFSEGFLARERRCFTKCTSRLDQSVFVVATIRDHFKRPVLSAFDCREGVESPFAVGLRQRPKPGINVMFGCAGRVKFADRALGRNPVDECRPGRAPRTLEEIQRIELRLRSRCLSGLSLSYQRAGAGPHLPHI